MSEKENEMEKEEEREIVDHWSHEHPLTLVETRRGDECYGCERRFSSAEQAYRCSRNKCAYEKLLHEECAEMARKIRHSVHPQHILLIQQNQSYLSVECAICKEYIESIGYRCTSSDCKFGMHMRCAQCSGVMDAVDDDAQSRSIIHHPSHPKHELRLFGKNSFKCDACGTTCRGNSYICTCCQYWIHERCASLPHTMKREDHHHSLSLSFHIPLEYIKFDYKCDVCNKHLMFKYWIYHCQLCRFAVHIKCAFNKSLLTTISNANKKGMIRLPTNDVSEELIRPFVMRQGGTIPPIPHDDDEMVNVKYNFPHHKHQLNLLSSSSPSHDDQNEEEEEDYDDDDYGKRSVELICDGCITPIFSSSSSSSSSSKYYYISCSECSYNLHIACFHLPPDLPSLPLRHRDDHDLILQSCPELEFRWECSVCRLYSNGLMYVCKKCPFKADIKCASLPDTIYHAAHPHLLNHVSNKGCLTHWSCAADCGYSIYYSDRYECSSCDFTLHVGCAVLPASTTSSRWDKQHPLPLTYDANVNHPGEFYCDQCEEEMNPKSWMYHCRQCDLSFHLRCFLATSGWFRNTKFGQKYVNAADHPHPLTYQLLTTKHRCDVCGKDRLECRGFQCASCNFFICLFYCGQKMLEKGDIQ